MRTLQQIGIDIGALVEQKNAAYGDSFRVSGEALRLLYPNGVPSDQLDDALLLARIWDKMKRIATNRDAFGESPYNDIAGYGVCGVALHQKKEKQNECPGSASERDAGSQPKGPHGSAAKSTKQRTTPSGKGILANAPSLQLKSYSPQPGSAPAPTATEDASRSADVDRRKRRNKADLCARPMCIHRISCRHTWTWITDDDRLTYCCESCKLLDEEVLGPCL